MKALLLEGHKQQGGKVMERIEELEKAIKSWIKMVSDGVCTVDEATAKIMYLVVEYVNIVRSLNVVKKD